MNKLIALAMSATLSGCAYFPAHRLPQHTEKPQPMKNACISTEWDGSCSKWGDSSSVTNNWMPIEVVTPHLQKAIGPSLQPASTALKKELEARMAEFSALSKTDQMLLLFGTTNVTVGAWGSRYKVGYSWTSGNTSFEVSNATPWAPDSQDFIENVVGHRKFGSIALIPYGQNTTVEKIMYDFYKRKGPAAMARKMRSDPEYRKQVLAGRTWFDCRTSIVIADKPTVILEGLLCVCSLSLLPAHHTYDIIVDITAYTPDGQIYHQEYTDRYYYVVWLFLAPVGISQGGLPSKTIDTILDNMATTAVLDFQRETGIQDHEPSESL